MIRWQNIKSEREGKAKNKDHFDRLNALSNGHLRIIEVTEKVSKSSKDVAKKVKEEAKESASQD